MTFLAPWALAIGVVSALGVVFLHLVAQTRPAAYVLPTARFIPDQRSLVSRVAPRPRDLVLLLLRVLLLLVASAAFARPVLTPSRGTVGHIVLLDRSRVAADVAEEVRTARALVPSGAPLVLIAFDSTPTILDGTRWDSLAALKRSDARGSLTAALMAARRASVALSELVDSVQLHVVSPLSRWEFDAGTNRARASWPGAIDVQRTSLRADSATATWRMSRPIPVSDPLGPSVATMKTGVAGQVSQLSRGSLSAADTAFAHDGGTVVHWDSTMATRMAAEGLAVGDDVIVATLGRMPVPSRGRVVARWADGTPAAVEERLGSGCMRSVGVRVPTAGDLPLHPPFQRLVRGLLAPCGFTGAEVGSDSSVVAAIVGSPRALASARALRATVDHPSSLARWLLLAALLLALVELALRSRGPVEVAA